MHDNNYTNRTISIYVLGKWESYFEVPEYVHQMKGQRSTLLGIFFVIHSQRKKKQHAKEEIRL
jgi:deoxycytidine triphosphate deaminase